jgi:hypothetical protein
MASRSFESKASERDFAAARRDWLNIRDAAFGGDESMIEIIYSGTDVPRNQIEDFAQPWYGPSCVDFNRQVFFTGSKRLCFGMSGHDTIRHATIQRNSFMTRVTSD